MNELEELFKALNPQETLMKTITKTKTELTRIKLPKLDDLKKHCRYSEIKKETSETYQIIRKYQTLRKNLQRIWLYTRDRRVLAPMIYMKRLQPFDKLADGTDQETPITGELKQSMNLLSQEIEKLLATYEDLHTKEKDEVEMFITGLMNTEEE